MTEDNKLKHHELCLALSDTNEGSVVRLQRCSPHDTKQVCIMQFTLFIMY